MTAYKLKCYPLIMLMEYQDENILNGGKIILPEIILQYINFEDAPYPLTFNIKNFKSEIETHCGVLEFTAEPSTCYLPYSMMNFLKCEIGDIIHVKRVLNLPVGKMVKFQVDNYKFFDEIKEQKIFLEQILKYYSTLTKNDIINITYNDSNYKFLILETKPDNAINITDCDLTVEFIVKKEEESLYKSVNNKPRGVPYYDYKPGLLRFKK